MSELCPHPGLPATWQQAITENPVCMCPCGQVFTLRFIPGGYRTHVWSPVGRRAFWWLTLNGTQRRLAKQLDAKRVAPQRASLATTTSALPRLGIPPMREASQP